MSALKPQDRPFVAGPRADRLAKRLFEELASQPAPEHLVNLVDALEASDRRRAA